LSRRELVDYLIGQGLAVLDPLVIELWRRKLAWIVLRSIKTIRSMKM
jgi:hypothetical protein